MRDWEGSVTTPDGPKVHASAREHRVYCSAVENTKESMPKLGRSAVLTLRVPPDLERRIVLEARRKRRTKSAVLREALQSAFGAGAPADDPAREARRQSLLVSGRASEREVLKFIDRSADDQGWR